ncbi:FadR/GntR family transcriptional regulator [Pedococcus sp. 5OH_020]|uniref:FadR/GntR family transcriptional regulator n=1 Tax=Pedococcus sp. 5OH_020 TaxID=2989814 RepID=UPI0022EA0262|nr:FadR/GntR family transcriptional regulator [Pedococcus sp. 5OH_020]
MSAGKGMAEQQFLAKRILRPRAQVEHQIREAILRGDFQQGDKLPPETELARQFGVSRPTVREALGSLVAAGLIRKVPGVAGGSFVHSVTPDSLSSMLSESMDTIVRLGSLDIDELTAMRRVLEVPAASWAACNREDRHVSALTEIVERQRTTTIDDPRIVAYDRDFHVTISEASGNRLLSAFISAIHKTTLPARFLGVTPEVGRETVKQHIAIVSAIRGGSASDAAEAMDRHLEYVLRYSSEGRDGVQE